MATGSNHFNFNMSDPPGGRENGMNSVLWGTSPVRAGIDNPLTFQLFRKRCAPPLGPSDLFPY
jgi:hypothetical protein